MSISQFIWSTMIVITHYWTIKSTLFHGVPVVLGQTPHKNLIGWAPITLVGHLMFNKQQWKTYNVKSTIEKWQHLDDRFHVLAVIHRLITSGKCCSSTSLGAWTVVICWSKQLLKTLSWHVCQQIHRVTVTNTSSFCYTIISSIICTICI